MADLLNISINLSKLDKSRIIKDKNGNNWLNLSGWLNDEADDYGNYGFLTHTPTKEERDAKERLTILGNYKKPIQSTTNLNDRNNERNINKENGDDGDDLPF